MKTYFFKFFTLVLLCIIVLCSCTNNKNINATLDETNEITKTLDSKSTSSNSTSIESSNDSSDDFKVNEKQKVVNVFITNGEYSDGTYTFRKYSQTGNCSFVYSFSYKPEIDMFNCAVLVTTYTQISNMYDYGSVTFAWNDFKNALFYGYHELENTAIIEFDFNALSPQSNMTYKNYDYTIKKNSFKNLTNTGDINEYAQTCFECVNQSLSYAQSILYGYISPVTLW